jgi:MYXO-CTERM domain-containing protein
VLAAASLLLSSPAQATPCASPSECPTGFCVDEVCCDNACEGICEACSAAAKGGGADGTCGLASPGTVCRESYCDGGSFSFVGDGTCNAIGACIEPAPVSCLHNDPCAFDLCGDQGCEQAIKIDGTACGANMVCESGACVPGVPATSSSSGGSSGAGAGGAGGGGGGDGDPYPPVSDEGGCGCRAAGEAPLGGEAGLALIALALLRRQKRRSGAAAGGVAR